MRCSLCSETVIFFFFVDVRDIDCLGLIDNTNTFDVITLHDSQKIPGLTTFRQLEVTEKLNVSISSFI